MQITTNDLLLRYPVTEDAQRLMDLGSDERVTGWFSWGPYRQTADVVRWIDLASGAREAGADLAFVIEHRLDGVVGVTSLNELSARDRRAATGTWIGHDWWGVGINRQAKHAMATLAFEVCGLRRLTAYANVQNARSAAALRSFGFAHEGTLRRWHRHGDQELDVHVVEPDAFDGQTRLRIQRRERIRTDAVPVEELEAGLGLLALQIGRAHV